MRIYDIEYSISVHFNHDPDDCAVTQVFKLDKNALFTRVFML